MSIHTLSNFAKQCAKFIVLCAALLSLGVASPAFALETYGFVTIFGNVTPDTETCPAGESVVELAPRQYVSETPAVAASMSVEIHRKSDNSLVRSTNAISPAVVTPGICFDPVSDMILVRVDDDILYHSLTGTYSIQNPTNWVGQRITMHAHLRGIIDGPSFRHKEPLGGIWSNTQPNFVIDAVSLTTADSATGLSGINLLVSPMGLRFSIPVSGGQTPTSYTITLPAESLPDGWQSWGFYAGLNGGNPDPISAWSRLESFGVDRQKPTASGALSPLNPTGKDVITVKGFAQDQAALSGLAYMEVYVDGAPVKKCSFALPGTQGPTQQQECSAAGIGPYAPSTTHTYSVVAYDTAGNRVQSDTSFFVACTLDGTGFGVNPGQFRGCYYDETAGEIKMGDAPSGPVIASGTASATALNFSGSAVPPNGKSMYFRATWTGTFTFNPGLYTFWFDSSSNNSEYCFTTIVSGFNSECTSTISGNVTVNKRFTATTTATLRYTFTNMGTSPYFQRIGWRPAACDEDAVGQDQFVGCLYGGVNLNPLWGPAPLGPILTAPVPTSSGTALDFDWGVGTPNATFGKTDNFSALWRGSFLFPAGGYLFHVDHDDMIQVDFTTFNSATGKFSTTTVFAGSKPDSEGFYYTFPTEQRVIITIRYKEVWSAARVGFSWDRGSGGGFALCNAANSGINYFERCLYNGGPGLASVSMLLRTPNVTDPAAPPKVLVSTTSLAFNWGTSSPDLPFTGSDEWLVRWKGAFTFAPGTYTFYANTGKSAMGYNGILNAYMDGDHILFNSSFQGTSTYTYTFTTQTAVILDVDYDNIAGRASAAFGWERKPAGVVVNRVNPIAASYAVFPGYSPAGYRLVNWDGPSDFDTASVSFPKYTGATWMVIAKSPTSTAAFWGPYVHSHVWITNPRIDLYDSTLAKWTTVWSRALLPFTAFSYASPPSLINIPKQDTDKVLFTVPKTDGEFHWFKDMVLGFTGPSTPPGYAFTVGSDSGFSGMVSVDATLPSGLTKIGTWPGSCIVPAYSSCTVSGLGVKTPANGVFQTYPPITFKITGSGISTSTIVTLKTWGYDLAITPAAPLVVPPGTPVAYAVAVTSRNGWGGKVALGATQSPAEPTMTTMWDTTTLTVPAGGTASATLTVLSMAVTPMATYNIDITATADSPEGPFTQKITAILDIVSANMSVDTKPDLIAQNITSSVTPTPGIPVQFTGEIFNQGTSTAGVSVARFCLDNPLCGTSATGSLGTSSVAELNAVSGQVVTSKSWTPVLADVGVHILYLCADIGNDVDEGSELNNCFEYSFTVGSPIPPKLVVTPTNLSYGTVAVKETADRTITITNWGGGTLIGSLDMSTSPHFTCVSKCTYALSASSSQVATIRLTAPSAPGSVGEKFRANSNGGFEDVTANADIIDAITVADPVDFGSVTVTKWRDKVMTITNNSSQTIAVGTITVTGPFSCTTSCAFGPIPPHSSINVSLRFTPTVVGPATGTATVMTTPQTITVNLVGVGTPPFFKVRER